MNRARGLLLSGLLILLVFAAVVVLAGRIEDSEFATELVNQYGYLGVYLIAVASGFNILIPIPAPTFVPIFTAAGLPLYGIIAFMVLGTTTADLLAFYVGRVGKRFTEGKDIEWLEKIETYAKHRRPLVLPSVFLWAAFMPLPNELILIPLALLGFRLRFLILPLLLGTVIHITLLAMGAEGLAGLV